MEGDYKKVSKLLTEGFLEEAELFSKSVEMDLDVKCSKTRQKNPYMWSVPLSS